MEKDRLLGTVDQKAVTYPGFFKKGRFLFCLLTTACYLMLFGCAFPRIIVLDDPLSPEEHLNLGVAYEQSREYDSALKEFEKASKKLTIAYLYMGNIHFLRNEYEDAEFYYKKMIEIDPKNADAYNNLAWLYYAKRENLQEAEGLALKAIDLNPLKKDIYEDTLLKIREVIQEK
jgi:tetratricopeptide (TPR) repeat protein